MDNYFKTVNNCVTIESYILNQIKSYLFRTLSETVDQKSTLIEIGILINVRNKLVSAHCIVMSTVDENHKRCIFSLIKLILCGPDADPD